MTVLKKKIAAGEVVLGTMISEFASPNLVRILRTSGFEFAVADCEHGYFDFSQLAAMAAVGNGFSMPLVVRTPGAERGFIIKILDMGADGLLVPMVNAAGDAARVVEYAKYAPIGRRGLSTTRAHTDYNPPPLAEYLPVANDRTVVMVQIETARAVDNVRAIAETEGVDVLMIGPNDLAADFGHPGRLDADDMFAAVDRVVDAARAAGKRCGIIDSRISFLHKCRDRGMTVFSCGSEVGMLMKAAKGTVAEFNA